MNFIKSSNRICMLNIELGSKNCFKPFNIQMNSNFHIMPFRPQHGFWWFLPVNFSITPMILPVSDLKWYILVMWIVYYLGLMPG